MAILGCGYDAARARGKRPVPMWADTFLRDTMELSAEEVGAYHLVLYAMWKRPECSLPNNAKRLAQIARVSTRRWNAQVGPAILRLMDRSNGDITSKKLLLEARQTEDWCISQHTRKCKCCKLNGENGVRFGNSHPDQKEEEKDGKKAGKPLKSNKVTQTGDKSGDKPRGDPRTHPGTLPSQRPKYIGGGGSAGARDDEPPPRETERAERQDILTAIGADPISGLVGPNGRCIGNMADMAEARRWAEDLRLPPGDVLAVIREVMAKKPDGPPSSFKYFTQAMQRYAGTQNRPQLQPIDGGLNGPDHKNRDSGDRVSRAHQTLIEGFARAVSEDP